MLAEIEETMAESTLFDVIRTLDPASAWKMRWHFVADMNGDGQVTISDVWLWAQWAFDAPGDCFLLVIMLKMQPTATFLEITPQMLSGGWSFFISLVCWWLLYISIVHRQS
jgi:hypothetical protein